MSRESKSIKQPPMHTCTWLLAQRCGPVARKLAAKAHWAIVRRRVAVDDGHAPVAFLFDAEVVTTHLDAEPAILTPVRACTKQRRSKGGRGRVS